MMALLADLWENIRVALDGLLANKLRSALTMLGVIIGVAAVIALLSIGAGAQAQITDQINSIGTNMLIVMSMSRGRVGGAGGGTGGITNDDVASLSDSLNVPDAGLVVPEYSQNMQIIYGDNNFNTTVLGTTPDYQALYDLTLLSGDFIADRDIDNRAKDVVLGAEVAEELFGDFDPVGQKIRVADSSGKRTSLSVIGVLGARGGSMMNDVDNTLFVPLSTMQTKLANARNVYGDLTVSRVNIMAASEGQVSATESQVDAILQARHGVGSDEDADYMIINQADMLTMATNVTGTLTVFLGAVAGISLLVGGIGIMNIMLVSVTERTREIGLRKAIGARKVDILIQFLMEAVLLSVLGGTAGIALGVGLARLVNLTGMFNAVVTSQSVVLAVSFSFITGLFSGIYPANKAASLNPIDALRYE